MLYDANVLTLPVYTGFPVMEIVDLSLIELIVVGPSCGFLGSLRIPWTHPNSFTFN